jgi:glycosidase
MMKVYNSMAQDFVYANPDNILIFAENHDTNRLAWLLKGKKGKQKMVMALLATMRGIPQLYCGSEWMMRNNAKQGHGEERLDMPGGWPGDKRSVFEASSRTKVENEVFDYTKKLFNWRKTAGVIHTGKLMQFLPVDNNLYVYFRYTGTERVMVVINNSREEKNIDWSRYAEMTGGYTRGVDVVSGQTVVVDEPWRVAPQTAQVVHFRK